MYIIQSDLVTGINGAGYLKGQIVQGDVFVPGSIDDLISINAIALYVAPKSSKTKDAE